MLLLQGQLKVSKINSVVKLMEAIVCSRTGILPFQENNQKMMEWL